MREVGDNGVAAEGEDAPVWGEFTRGHAWWVLFGCHDCFVVRFVADVSIMVMGFKEEEIFKLSGECK